MADWVHAIEHGWVIVDNPPGPDVDEFADAEQVSTALSTAADSGLLAVQHPHRTPAAIAAGLTLRQAIPRAVSTLDSIKAAHYRPATDVVAIYRVSGFDGTAIGLLGMVDPDVAGGDGLRSSEDVYPAVVAERAEVLAGLRCATSAAMLVPTDDGGRLTDELSVARQRLGAPDVSTVDAFGRRHELWLVFAGELRDRLLAVAGAADLLVADGNHRVAATRAAGASGLYALITAGPRLRVGSIHRVLVGTGLTVDDLESAWHAVGLAV
ncbi:MAG: DUF1015 family protein, partial [Sciscionella sp.]|nr:DUF1015 family protein [Sciscionella sp.]